MPWKCMNKRDFVSRRGVGGSVGWNEPKTQSTGRSLVGTAWRWLAHWGGGCGDERVLGDRRTFEKRWAHVNTAMGIPARRSILTPYGRPKGVASSPRATISGSNELGLVCFIGLPKKVHGSPGQRASTVVTLRRVLGDWAGSSGERLERKLESLDGSWHIFYLSLLCP